MKYWKTALSVFAALSASPEFAEDFKTINGKEYNGRDRSSDAFQAIVDSLTRPAKRK